MIEAWREEQSLLNEPRSHVRLARRLHIFVAGESIQAQEIPEPHLPKPEYGTDYSFYPKTR